MPAAADATQLLQEATGGDPSAPESLLPLVYAELRRLAASHLRLERADHTLQATEIVHEAYLRLIDQSRVDWRNRAHFFAMAALTMRRILVDHARRRARQKRTPPLAPVEGLVVEPQAIDVLALDRALAKLAEQAPHQARVVELRYFGGLTAKETAQVMGIGLRTVERYWLYARSWLFRELSAEDPGELDGD